MPFLMLLVTASFFAGDATPTPGRRDGACQCVPTTLCADNDAAVNGQGLLDVRVENEICNNYFETCCENPIVDINLPAKHIFKGCGAQNPVGISSRITSDSNAEFGELPWSVVILLKDASTAERIMYKCGGSLIHPQVTLTAAHCVSGIDATHLTVRVGEWDTKTQHEPLPHQQQIVQEVTKHPLYQEGSLKNDIALLFVAEPFLLADNVGIICLPPPNLQMEKALCTAGGWGKGTLKKGKHSSVLKKVTLPLVPRHRCLEALRSTRLGPFYNLHRSFICAGGEKNKDTCKGDGGSPLVCPIPGAVDRYFQMGIVSWGIGCGETETPGVYVNVPLYTDWIDKQLTAKNLDVTLYRY